MKARMIILLTAFLFLLCCTSADGEGVAEVHITAGEDWSWNPGSYNLFSGEINLSDYSEQDLMISLSTDLSYGDDPEEGCDPLFTVVNGERITMLQQTSYVLFTPDVSSPVLSFSGSVMLPEKGHVRHVIFQFHIINSTDGKEITCLTDEISVRDNNSGRAAGSFYFAFDINRITLILGATALLVWSAVLIRSRYRKKKTGE